MATHQGGSEMDNQPPPPAIAPKTIVLQNAEEVAQYTADLFADAVASNPGIVLGLATGGTPIQMYRLLVQLYRDGQISFQDVTTFNLDEYIGLAPDHPQSYRYFMNRHFFDPIDIDLDRTHVPDGLAADPLKESRRYESQISDAGGIDLQLLGIGHNGHIAFNEPGSPLDSRTRVVELSSETIENNARFFESSEEVPRKAITQGIATILEAKQIVLMATGKGKAEAVHELVNGKPNDQCPATFLLLHPNVYLILDRDAASLLDDDSTLDGCQTF